MTPRRVAVSVALGIVAAAAAFACATVNGRGPLAMDSKVSAPSAFAKPEGRDGGIEALIDGETARLASLGFVPDERVSLVLGSEPADDGGHVAAQGVLPAFESDRCVRLVVVSHEGIRARVVVGGIERSAEERDRPVASFGPVCGRARDSLAVEVHGPRGASVAIVRYSLKKIADY
jgi:hypothetical protein